MKYKLEIVALEMSRKSGLVRKGKMVCSEVLTEEGLKERMRVLVPGWTEKMKLDAWIYTDEYPKTFILDEMTGFRIYEDGDTELEQLRRWKKEAIEANKKWDAVFDFVMKDASKPGSVFTLGRNIPEMVLEVLENREP